MRVIDPNGNQLGIMDTSKALELARQYGLDLAEISPTAKPPVCKIVDFGKFKYEQKKKAKETKKKQQISELKEIYFRPQTQLHDINIKVRNIIKFLASGHKVRCGVKFKGREMAHSNLGFDVLKQVIDMVGESGIVEVSPKMEGRSVFVVFAPSKTTKKVDKENEKSSILTG